MKVVATTVTALLAIAYPLLLLAIHAVNSDPSTHAWATALEWISVFVQAALVGAIADWFAVVALFRHPLGIPLPHTAVIPRNHARLANAMSEFIVSSFLNREAVERRLKITPPSESIREWLHSPQAEERFTAGVVGQSKDLAILLQQPGVTQALRKHGTAALLRLPWDRALPLLVESLLRPESTSVLTAKGLEEIAGLLQKSQEALRTTVKAEMPWYIPAFLHDQIFDRLLSRARTFLEEVKNNPEHPYRQLIVTNLRKWISESITTEETKQVISGFLANLLESPQVQNYLEELFRGTAKDLSTAGSRTEEALKAICADLFTAFQGLFNTPSEFSKAFDVGVTNAAGSLFERYRSAVQQFITDTVMSWQQSDLVSRIEEHVSEDLQYIRLNGALVGGFLGLVLHTVALLTR